MNKIKELDKQIDSIQKLLDKDIERMTPEMKEELTTSKRNYMLERVYLTIRKRLDK